MPKDLNSLCENKNFETIFRNYSENVRNFIFYKCGDLQQAEDLTQEAFVKLWENCSKIAIEKAKSFLFTVANNAFLNEVAHKKVVLKHKSTLTNNSTNITPQFILEEQEFMKKLNQTISDLPIKQREVFLLSRVEKKKYKEIAEIIGITVKAVEKRMSLALISLRDKIGDI